MHLDRLDCPHQAALESVGSKTKLLLVLIMHINLSNMKVVNQVKFYAPDYWMDYTKKPLAVIKEIRTIMPCIAICMNEPPTCGGGFCITSRGTKPIFAAGELVFPAQQCTHSLEETTTLGGVAAGKPPFFCFFLVCALRPKRRA